jgi:hypothetical protein
MFYYAALYSQDDKHGEAIKCFLVKDSAGREERIGTMSDAFKHVNRHGDAYFLQCKTGADGKAKYSFARKLSGSPAKNLPDGYEVRENPESAQVTLRKVKPTLIRADEKQLLEAMIRGQKPKLLFIVDAEDRSLVVYTSDMDADVRVNMLSHIFPMNAQTACGMRDNMIANATYAKMMRFTLIDIEKRLFNMDRWCFMGSIDDWYFIEGERPLATLAEKYVRHLGEESFFELM